MRVFLRTMTASSSAMSTYSEAQFVACNIYISSASSTNSTLQNLLKAAQDHCRSIREKDSASTGFTHGGIGNVNQGDRCWHKEKSTVAVIHAFADVPYKRSSFHLAGHSDCVADVALNLILNSFDQIDVDSEAQGANAHPSVGLVDHVSVMPMVTYPVEESNSVMLGDICEKGLHPSQLAAADAARAIGSGINERGLVNVHYYGLACPNRKSLAKVRKEKTAFFNSDSTSPNSDASKKGDCTIGAPFHFVENYNIRMSTNVGLAQAKTLTQFVRGRNIASRGYGIEGVEALTLPYQMCSASGEENLVYEVACNLTNPRKGSVNDIEEAVDKWIGQQTPPSAIDDVTRYFVHKKYRVGTTEKQCIDTLMNGCSNNDTLNSQYWSDHDDGVLDRFQQYLTGQQA